MSKQGWRVVNSLFTIAAVLLAYMAGKQDSIWFENNHQILFFAALGCGAVATYACQQIANAVDKPQ